MMIVGDLVLLFVFVFRCVVKVVMAAVEGKTTLDSGWFAARFNEVLVTYNFIQSVPVTLFQRVFWILLIGKKFIYRNSIFKVCR
jgi:hypothetical protein